MSEPTAKASRSARRRDVRRPEPPAPGPGPGPLSRRAVNGCTGRAGSKGFRHSVPHRPGPGLSEPSSLRQPDHDVGVPSNPDRASARATPNRSMRRHGATASRSITPISPGRTLGTADSPSAASARRVGCRASGVGPMSGRWAVASRSLAPIVHWRAVGAGDSWLAVGARRVRTRVCGVRSVRGRRAVALRVIVRVLYGWAVGAADSRLAVGARRMRSRVSGVWPKGRRWAVALRADVPVLRGPGVGAADSMLAAGARRVGPVRGRWAVASRSIAPIVHGRAVGAGDSWLAVGARGVGCRVSQVGSMRGRRVVALWVIAPVLYGRAVGAADLRLAVGARRLRSCAFGAGPKGSRWAVALCADVSALRGPGVGAADSRLAVGARRMRSRAFGVGPKGGRGRTVGRVGALVELRRCGAVAGDLSGADPDRSRDGRGPGGLGGLDREPGVLPGQRRASGSTPRCGGERTAWGACVSVVLGLGGVTGPGRDRDGGQPHGPDESRLADVRLVPGGGAGVGLTSRCAKAVWRGGLPVGRETGGVGVVSRSERDQSKHESPAYRPATGASRTQPVEAAR